MICSQFSRERQVFISTTAKSQGGNTMQMQVVLEANTLIKSNKSLLSAMVRLLKNPFLNLVRKKMS
jgi:hypothetical protein